MSMLREKLKLNVDSIGFEVFVLVLIVIAVITTINDFDDLFVFVPDPSPLTDPLEYIFIITIVVLYFTIEYIKYTDVNVETSTY